MKPQPPTRDQWRRVYEAAANRRMMQEEEYQKGDGLGGCLCILVVTVLAILVYSALFFAWI
jgi:hypothetical protein